MGRICGQLPIEAPYRRPPMDVMRTSSQSNILSLSRQLIAIRLLFPNHNPDLLLPSNFRSAEILGDYLSKLLTAAHRIALPSCGDQIKYILKFDGGYEAGGRMGPS